MQTFTNEVTFQKLSKTNGKHFYSEDQIERMQRHNKKTNHNRKAYRALKRTFE